MTRPQDHASWFTIISTYCNYAWLIIFGYLLDYFEKFLALFKKEDKKHSEGYAPLFKSFENFYARRLYKRIKDCWNRPISSAPGAWIEVQNRFSRDYNETYEYERDENNQIKTTTCLNLASYNYLGFAENPEHVTKDVLESLEKYGVATCSARNDLGYTAVHEELERTVAEFVGKEDAICFGMGFATNTTGIALLCEGKDTLIISDSDNHASIILGSRAAQAKILVFPHNDVKSLEKILRKSIAHGQPRTRRPWKKIIILIEGIYSMEGGICALPQIVELKKKYKAYLYVDEAHSIGALGPNGKGVCDFCGVDPKDVDVLMGTFTKSFGSVGGYIAADRHVINYLRRKCASPLYAAPLAPVCAQQIISAINVITGKDGTNIGKEKLTRLRENAIYFKRKLVEMGFDVIGDEGSPVVCIMLYQPAKMPGFSRLCLEKNLAVVVVGSPATDIIGSRVRFCLSAAHTREDLEYACKVIDEVGDWTGTKYKKPWFSFLRSN